MAKTYFRLVNKYPLLMQCLQTGILMGAGDLLAQTAVEKKPLSKVEPRRTIQFFVIGSCLVGPSCSMWYKVLNKHVGSSGRDVAIKKVLLDQLFFGPCFLPIMLFVLGTLKGQTPEETFGDMKVQYPQILIANYKVWPFVQLVNFYFVPLNFQVVVVQIVGLFWNTFISWKTENTRRNT